jgi:hypothetical protein
LSTMTMRRKTWAMGRAAGKSLGMATSPAGKIDNIDKR